MTLRFHWKIIKTNLFTVSVQYYVVPSGTYDILFILNSRYFITDTSIFSYFFSSFFFFYLLYQLRTHFILWKSLFSVPKLVWIQWRSRSRNNNSFTGYFFPFLFSFFHFYLLSQKKLMRFSLLSLLKFSLSLSQRIWHFRRLN